MKEKLLKILGKYKVIGDTTYGLGFEDADELVNEIIKSFINVISTHTEKIGGYCDTGNDMDWFCRSHCMELAIKRIK